MPGFTEGVPRPVRRAVAAVPAALLTAALLAGCASGASGAGSASGASSASGGAAAGKGGSHAATSGHATAAPPKGSTRGVSRSAPKRLRIPSIGVDTPVMGLGLAPDGTVQVPPVAKDSPAGWYRDSPAPGRTGPSVILGHVTVGRFGDGVFRHLDRLKPGARISVRLRDGDAVDFAVDRVQTVAKSRFPTKSVYGDVDHPALRLITCGGPRTGAGGGYRDNVVVYASPATGTRTGPRGAR